MLIKNFGKFWERGSVHFGWQGKQGCLLGYNSRVKEVDFREQIGIYVLYDKNMKVVYVGQAGNGKATIYSRIKQHKSDHLWNRWEYFSWYGFRSMNQNGVLSQKDHVDKQSQIGGSDLLNEIEGLLITILEPHLNKQGAKWSDVEEYFQVEHEDLEEYSLDHLIEKQEELEKKIDRLLEMEEV